MCLHRKPLARVMLTTLGLYEKIILRDTKLDSKISENSAIRHGEVNDCYGILEMHIFQFLRSSFLCIDTI